MAIKGIRGFEVLPVKLAECESLHYLFFKKHDVRSSEKNESSGGRSIFFFNLPVCTTATVMKKFFQEIAIGSTIESFTPSFLSDCEEDLWLDLGRLTTGLDLQQHDNSHELRLKIPKNCGIVTFVDKSAFLLALNSLKKLASASMQANWPLEGPFGLIFYLKKYQAQVLDNALLAQSVSDALESFDNAERDSYDQLQQQAQVVDEDGFTLVVGSHRKTKAGIMGKQKLAATVEVTRAADKLKKKEKADFYRFQLRERKKEEMNDLLKKFKEDQERVRLMKEKKRFRPY
ncbi:uncharacterized protein PRCAT00001236001 [Priceomyces carsonii]|uniref:uncharacterized protein n=1 Tax=Priceomyces carsonii TaxID=28549 RepID=UPI002ED88403|nr:unnamed protein product [Priceomyces carsonii]